jgi:N utilization substance protein A
MNSELTRTHAVVSTRKREGGPDSAGQCGDTQGLPTREEADSESVEELLEEGQAFEAEAILGVEDASGEEVAEVHTRQFREDDVPPEYRDAQD